jgi:membrane-bound serine protease (ClpP class)
MRIGTRCLFLTMSLLVSLIAGPTAQADSTRGPVYYINFKEIVHRASADYLIRAIEYSEQNKAQCLIVKLDTPGGELMATREMVQALLNSRVPVVVYVHPAGAQAGSAGVFITLAAHIAAMTPGTNIGAATPISGSGEDIPGDRRQKVINDTVAFARTIAKQRNRNEDWAAQAVKQAASVPDSEALQKRVVDLIAPDVSNLLEQINGRKVRLDSKTVITLQTKGLIPEEIPKTLRESFLLFLAHPNVLYVLLTLAMIGLIAELQNPGATLPGVVGVISFLLTLYAGSVLPVNALGVALIVLAFILLIIDLFSTSHGVLTAGALASFVIGSIILFKTDSPALRVSIWLIATMTVLIGGFFAVATYSGLKAQFRKKESGQERLIGKPAQVRKDINPVGQVFVDGALWKAVTLDEPIPVGEYARIERIEGLTLYVRKITGE